MFFWVLILGYVYVGQSSRSQEDSRRKYEGRLIYYYVADDDGNVDYTIEWPSFQLKGHGLEELTQKLEEETRLEDIIVCSRNSTVSGKLCPLRLALPPNNATMHVVVVPSTSRGSFVTSCSICFHLSNLSVFLLHVEANDVGN